MKKPFPSLLIFAVLTMLHPAYASNDTQYHFRHYDISQGLSQNSVMTLHQDSKGFIWIGTKNGLNRFDGNSFKVFLKNDTPDGLHNSMIYSIAEDSSENLWIATDSGIEIYDPHTEKFSSFNVRTANGNMISGTVNKIIIDRHDTAWILAGNNLFRYSVPDSTLTRMNDDLRKHTEYRPAAIYKDDIQNLLYIGVPADGLFSYNPLTGKYTHVASCPYTPTDICIYKRHFALMGTINHGIWLINLATGESRQMKLDPDDPDIFVRVITAMSESEYWIGTESGVYILKDGAVEHIQHETFYDRSLSDNAIYAIMSDRDNGIWIGSYFGGVNYIPNRQPYFTSITPRPSGNSISGFRVREFAGDNKGRLWIATEDNGLNCYEPNSEGGVKFHNCNTGNNYVPFNNIQCLDISGDRLWAGTFSNGIYVIDLNTFRTVHYEKSGEPWSLENNDVFAICNDSGGTTWIGTSSGASIFIPETGGFRRFDKTGGSFISDIMEDSEGIIWFTTYNNGIFRYDKRLDQIRNFRHDPEKAYSLCYDRIISAYEDSKNRIWFGSEDGGFCRFNRIDETFTSVTTADGLPSNVIHKIIEDDNGHLWISTNNGIVHFDPEAMKIIDTYNQFNGLPSRQFNYNSGYKTPDGTIYFGSINGFVYFNPEFFHIPIGKHRVILTEFSILGQDDEGNSLEKEFSGKAMPYTSSIQLDYRQTSFSLSFSALDYSGKGNGKYAYKLEGAENTWNYIPDKIPSVSYNRLMPGNYDLLIKYSPDGHTWDDEATSLAISIQPPFWKTGWATASLIIFLFLLAAGIVAYIMFRREKRLNDKLAMQEQKQSEEIYKAKIDFFTNMAHEIRTPITLIKVPLDYILNKELSKEELKENLITMERNANRLLALVNQLLDFRKLESDAMTLNKKERDVVKIVKSTFDYFLPMARQKNIEMTLTCSESPMIAIVDEEAITKICSNLLSNAIKYAATYIKVELNLNDEYSYFSISVHNDGEKIPENMRGRIFEAFFQIKSTWQSSQPGSGIGLTLASSLTKMHNGNLYIDDSAKDTAFVVQIPTGTDKKGDGDSLEAQANDPYTPEEQDMVSDMTDQETYDDESVQGGSKEYTVLIVEDNEELLNLLAQQLEVQYDILTATNGVEAMKILDSQMVNLIVSDVMMPLMDGFELCSNVKSSINTSHIPVILLTAKTNLKDKISGLETGADAYIGKPFSTSYLLAQIDSLLKNRAALMKKFADNPLLGTNIMAQSKADEEFLGKLTDVVMHNISNDMFGVEDLAKEMGMSRSNLHRKIKGVTKMTPGNFIMILRLKKAAELLLDGGYRITEICVLVGIGSTSYFSKSFYRQFGVLPKDYAKSVKNEKNA